MKNDEYGRSSYLQRRRKKFINSVIIAGGCLFGLKKKNCLKLKGKTKTLRFLSRQILWGLNGRKNDLNMFRKIRVCRLVSVYIHRASLWEF